MAELSKIAGSLFAVICAYIFYNYLQRQIIRRKWTKQHGCANPPKYPHRDPIGLDLFISNIRNAKNFRMLEGWKERWQKYGTTFSGMSMGVRNIYTIDPRNLQSVHALNFAHYGVQPIRRDATLPFLGEGVFTMDGPFWEHSRALIRPTFTRTNVANLPAFEVNFQKFLNLLPKDGKTADLKPLFYRLVNLNHIR
jgi:cytochrome P450 monooxygenase